MSHNKLRAGVISCLLLSFFGQTVVAQESVAVGTMTATIDGDAYAGQTIDIPSQGTSTAEFRATGPVMSVSIQAHATGAESFMQDVMVVEFMLMGAGGAPNPMTPSVSWWPEGMNAPFFQSDEGGTAEVTLDTLSLDDPASATGSFVATLCRKDGFFAEADTSDCRAVEGRFETALREGS